MKTYPDLVCVPCGTTHGKTLPADLKDQTCIGGFCELCDKEATLFPSEAFGGIKGDFDEERHYLESELRDFGMCAQHEDEE